MQGGLVCPAEAKPEQWQAFSFPCAKSEQELLALMDIYTAFLGTLPEGQGIEKYPLHQQHQAHATAAARRAPVALSAAWIACGLPCLGQLACPRSTRGLLKSFSALELCRLDCCYWSLLAPS